MAHVFISYDREDRDFAEVVQARLEKAGHTTVMDFDILSAGDDWQDRLDAEIRRSQALVVIMTPEARASDYVAYEWAFALGAGVRVIPLEYRPTAFSARLDALHRLDFKERARPWDTLLAEVKKAEQANPLASIEVAAAAPAPVKQAARAVDSLDPGDRSAAIRTLAGTDHPAARAALASALAHPIADVRAAAAVLFPDRTDARTVPGLIDALRDRSADGLSAHAFAARISAIGAAAMPALLAELARTGDSTKATLVDALGQAGDASAVATLEPLLADGDAEVRAAAAGALGRIGDPGAAPALRAALADEVARVREAAAAALGSVRDADAVPELIRLVDEDAAAVRAAAARSLGRIGDGRAAPAVTAALGDDDDGVRRAAIEAAESVCGPAAAGPMRERLEQAGPAGMIGESDSALMLALLRLGDAGAIPLVERRLIEFRSGYFGQVEAMCSAMMDLGPEGTAAAVRVLTGARSNSVRDQAARALARTDVPEAAAALKAWRRTRS
jgi:HEAT repeat protein